MVIAILEREPLPVCGDRQSEFVTRFDPMHGKSGFVGPDDALVGVHEDHPFGQASNDLLKLPTVGTLPGDGLDGVHGRGP